MTSERIRFKLREARFFLDRFNAEWSMLLREHHGEAVEYYLSAFLNACYSAHDGLRDLGVDPETQLPAAEGTHATTMRRRRNAETHRLPLSETIKSWIDARKHPRASVVGNAVDNGRIEVEVVAPVFTDEPSELAATACERYWVSLNSLAEALE
jgi:hypothetical protein